MGSRLGRRVVQFANLPIKLVMPKRLSNISEISLKTIPSATKIEIKRVLESLYGFNVDKVRTLNMDGKKKKRGGLLLARPDYKKAYVTLLTPLSLSPDLFPLRAIAQTQSQPNPTALEDRRSDPPSHWLHGREDRKPRAGPRGRPPLARPAASFPWSSMRSSPSPASPSRSRGL